MTLQCAKFIIIIQVLGIQTQITLITSNIPWDPNYSHNEHDEENFHW